MLSVRRLKWLRLVVIAGALLGRCGAAVSDNDGGWRIVGVVTKVHDADSIHVTPAGQERRIIRLNGIDAPEVKQAWGKAARDILRTTILNREVEAVCHKKDQYQRNVCVVLLNGDDVNLRLVEAGLAHHYKRFENEQKPSDRRLYADAQIRAQSSGIGLWSSKYIEPWVFRKLNK